MNYPECEKLSAHDGERRTIITFLEWLEEQGYWPEGCKRGNSLRGSHDHIAMRFLGIDEAKLDEERRRMLEAEVR